jgi:hypothetical protein
MIFTVDHIRCLAKWCEDLQLIEYQSKLYDLYHNMSTGMKKSSTEEINSLCMTAIQIIRDNEKDKEMFYRTMNSWGL